MNPLTVCQSFLGFCTNNDDDNDDDDNDEENNNDNALYRRLEVLGSLPGRNGTLNCRDNDDERKSARMFVSTRPLNESS